VRERPRREVVRALAAGFVGALAALGIAAALGLFDGDDGDGSGLPPLSGDDRGGLGERLNEIYDRASPSVVFVQARVVGEGPSPFGIPRPEEGTASGSGFVLDRRGHVVTNAHVVADARNVLVQFEEGKLAPARVVGSDLSTDLAVLRVDPDGLDLSPLPLGDSKRVDVGDPVAAIGNPLGLEDTITSGIVSALQRRITAPNGLTIDDVIQSDAAINPGNSGGPLLDAGGRVIGVNSQIATAGTQGFVGIGFAVPSNTAKQVVPQLIEEGEVRRAFLGVTTLTVTPRLARQLGLGVEQGALVAFAAEGSPADRAGLRGAANPQGVIVRAGDVIVAFAGEAISDSEEAVAAIRARQPGEVVTIEFVRRGERGRVRVRLADRPD
jgi:S1-C subfamily serine protease